MLVLAALTSVAVPVWILQPFKPETPRGLEIAFEMSHWAPWITVASLLISFILVGWLWQGRRWPSRLLSALLLVPLLASAWFARQNHFEWLFNPLDHSSYVKASETAFLADSDMVLAVTLNGESVAYPVRLMAYHHVVQDVVGGTPITVTY